MRKYFLVCIVLDFLWATITATLVATSPDLTSLTTSGELPAVKLLVWIIFFLFGLFEGAVYLALFLVIGATALHIKRELETKYRETSHKR